jgi:hypothetical protein
VSDIVKSKIRQLYQFLKEANQLRFRPVRLLSEQPKVVRLADMPNHPSMQLFRPVRTEDAEDVPDTLIRVRRPQLTRCPEPPASLQGWLLPNWDDPTKQALYAASQNATAVNPALAAAELERPDRDRIRRCAEPARMHR